MRSFGVEKFRKLVFVGSFSVITEFLMGFLGSVLSGHLLGEDALAGVSLMSPVFTAVIFLSGLFGVGMGVNYALEMGRCDKRRAHEIFTQGLWSVLAVGAASALLLLVGFDAYVRFMNPSPAVAAYAADYCRWFVPVAILEPLAVFLLNCCYADGDDRQCYVIYAAQLAANLGISYAALKSGRGTAGCAMGALAGFAAAVAIGLLHFRKAGNSFRLVRHFRLADSLRIVKSSFGDASGFLCNALLFFFLGKYFLDRFGSDMLPVLSVVIATLGLLEVFNGVGVAAQPIVTVYVGERNTLGARAVMNAALRISIVEGAAASLLLFCLPDFAIALVGISSEPLVAASRTAVRLIALGFVFTAVANLLNGYYILISREMMAVLFTFWKWLLVPVVTVFAFWGLGMNGVWAALGIAPLIAMGAFAAGMIRRYGRTMCPFLLPRDREAKIRMFSLVLNEHEIVETAHTVAAELKKAGANPSKTMRAELMTEEVLMAVKDRNKGRRVLAEVTLDLNDAPTLTLRDDGEIFDITDADAKVRSLRTFLVASVMERQQAKVNLITTGFNRNVFRF